MAKKNFKKSARESVASAFFSDSIDIENTQDILGAQVVEGTLDTLDTKNTPDIKSVMDRETTKNMPDPRESTNIQDTKYGWDTEGGKDTSSVPGASTEDKEPEVATYRLNLKLKGEYKEYLSDIAWKNRTSITAYLNDLIEADMKINE